MLRHDCLEITAQLGHIGQRRDLNQFMTSIVAVSWLADILGIWKDTE